MSTTEYIRPQPEDLVTIEVTWSLVDLRHAVSILRSNQWRLTAAAIEAGIEALPEPLWVPDEDQIAAYQAAGRRGSGLAVSRAYAINHLQRLHTEGLRL